VHDEIKGEGESENAFTTLAKCKTNLAINTIEDMDSNIVNIEFYAELAFLEEWLAKPKYESEYGNDASTVAEEIMGKIKKTIGGVEPNAPLEKKMKMFLILQSLKKMFN